MALDRDGMPGLSAAEISGAAATLNALDRNGDGLVTGDELPAVAPGGRGRGERGRGGRGEEGDGPRPASDDDLTETLMAFDRNGDGKLTRAEVPERFQGIFDRADANKDGELTPAELKQSAATQTPSSTPERGRGDGEGRREGREARRGGPFGGVDPLLAAIDRNGDGRLSADERDDVPAALRRFDRNGDGMVTIDEIFTGFGRGRG
jgi:Ca2+-binding EF-hand superfamily protein